jgi:hypothetical protein
MSVATSASSSADLQPLSTGRKLVPVAFALLLLPLAGTRRMRRNGRWLGRFFCLLLLALGGIAATTALSGCGSNSGGTKKTTTGTEYTITVQATSGGVQQLRGSCKLPALGRPYPASLNSRLPCPSRNLFPDSLEVEPPSVAPKMVTIQGGSEPNPK